MRVRERQVHYGMLFGAATLLVGWAIAFALTPPDLLVDTPRWKVALWVYLSAHFVPVSGIQVGGIAAAFTQIDLLAEVPALRSLRVVPVLLTALGGVLMVEVVGYTSRFRHIIQNSAALLYGYIGAGLLAFVASDVQPGVSMVIVLAALIAGAAYIGGTVSQRLTANVPVLAVTSLGGLVVIGLLVILGGVVVLRAVAPLVGVALFGVVCGALLAWTARNVPS